MIRKNKQNGYTLVELAIVLVIMGVLVGSIALGRELIESAKIKSMISDFESIEQAHYLYIKRTGHPPGVWRNSEGVFTSDKWGGSRPIYVEWYFNDLIAEGFIPEIESGGGAKMHAYDGIWIAASEKDFREAYIDAPQICAHNVPVWVAELIDIKLDDGIPNTGRVITGQTFNHALTTSYEVAKNSYSGRAHYIYTVCRAL